MIVCEWWLPAQCFTEVLAGLFGIFQRVCVRWVLFGLDDHPSLKAGLGQCGKNRREVDRAVARNSENASLYPVVEREVFLLYSVYNFLPNVFEMDVLDALTVILDHTERIHESRGEVTRIEQEVYQVFASIFHE